MKNYVTITEVSSAGVKNWVDFEKKFPNREPSGFVKNYLDKK